jgi:hypothetical protein
MTVSLLSFQVAVPGGTSLTGFDGNPSGPAPPDRRSPTRRLVTRGLFEVVEGALPHHYLTTPF